MPPVVIADGIPFPIMIVIMVLLTVTIMVVVGPCRPKAGKISAQETDTRCRARRGRLTTDPIGLPAHRDQFFQLAPIQPHPFTSGADVDRNAKALDFFHSLVAYGTLHCILSQFDWHSV